MQQLLPSTLQQALPSVTVSPAGMQAQHPFLQSALYNSIGTIGTSTITSTNASPPNCIIEGCIAAPIAVCNAARTFMLTTSEPPLILAVFPGVFHECMHATHG